MLLLFFHFFDFSYIKPCCSIGLITARDVFKAIYAAIDANPNAEMELTLETIVNLERISIEWRGRFINERSFVDDLKSNYENWQARLSVCIADQEKAAKEAKL